MGNISKTIQAATTILRDNGVVEPRREAKSLLSLALNKDKTFLIAHPEYELTEKESTHLRGFVNRRSNHEPFQHIAGNQHFYRLDFLVTPDVMIPRAETELIVESGIRILRILENPWFCEVGTGSGCISIAMLHEIGHASAIGLDISRKALAIAKQNAEINGVSDRIELMTSDIFATFKRNASTHLTKFDLIVSNPPYVPAKAMPTLQAEVRDFDPHIALTDGKDGLSIIRKIIIESPKFLRPNGFLLMEIGFDQSKKVGEMFQSETWKSVDIEPDLQGIPRMVKARLGPL